MRLVHDDRVSVCCKLLASNLRDHMRESLKRDRNNLGFSRQGLGQFCRLRAALPFHRDNGSRHVLKLLDGGPELLVEYAAIGPHDDLPEYLLIIGIMEEREPMSQPADGIRLPRTSRVLNQVRLARSFGNRMLS